MPASTKVPTGVALFRRNIPRIIGWFFGILWALLGAAALPHPYDRVGRAVGILIALIFLATLWRSTHPATHERPLFRAPAYYVAVAAEILFIYAASIVLPKFGAQQQVFSAVGLIVGLHFIGLWVATRSSRFLHITAGMCAVSLCSMFLPYAWHSLGLRMFVLGTGNAIVLWLAASVAD